MIEEDRSAVALNIDAKGCRPEVMAKAMARVDTADALAMTPTLVTIAEVTAPQLWIELELRDFLGIGHVRRVTMTSQVIATRTASTEDQAVKHLHNQGTP